MYHHLFVVFFLCFFLDWPGGSDGEIVRGNNQHVRGRPRHPQSQGLVERGHQLIQDKLAIAEAEWLATNNTPFPWHERLPFVQCKFNICAFGFVKRLCM